MTKNKRASLIRRRLCEIPDELEKQIQKLLKQKSLIQGYVYHSKRRCGKPGCRCNRGELHDACVIATTVAGKRTTRSLPEEMREEVSELAENYRRFREAKREFRRHTEEALDLMAELEELVKVRVFEQEADKGVEKRKK